MKKKSNIISKPKVSIVIPVHFGAEYIGVCLEAIFKQNYPKDKIEVIVVISKTTIDDTEKIAGRYPVKIVINPKILAEPGKTLGYKYCTGDLYLYLDSDAELVSENWLKNLTKPFINDETIVGATTRYMPDPKQNAFNRFMSRSPLQLPPMLEFLLPSFSNITIEKRKGYDLIKVDPKRCPPIGMCIFRKKILDKVISDPDNFNYVDIAIPIQLAELGYDKMAYVEKDAGFYHRRNSLMRELRRTRRDVAVTYLPVVGERKFHYVDFNNPIDLFKIIYWVVYVNLIIPSLLVGIYKTIKYKDWAGMFELPLNFLLTNYVIYLFLTEKNGRKLLKNVFTGKSVTSIKSHALEKMFFVDSKK